LKFSQTVNYFVKAVPRHVPRWSLYAARRLRYYYISFVYRYKLLIK